MRRDPAYWWLPWYRRPGLAMRFFRLVEIGLLAALWAVFCLVLWVVFIHWAANLW